MTNEEVLDYVLEHIVYNRVSIFQKKKKNTTDFALKRQYGAKERALKQVAGHIKAFKKELK